MKKILTIALLATFAFVACDKDEESGTATKNDVKISILKSDETNGDVCVRVENQKGEIKDSCFSVGTPYRSITVIVDKIRVTVGEGENAHDSIIFVYESMPLEEPDYTWETVTEHIDDHDTTYMKPIPKK